MVMINDLFKVIGLLSIIIILFYIYLVEFYLTLIVQEKRETVSLNRVCNPIIENARQEQFEINGQVYPRYVPRFLDKSLNFSCLNENSRSKVILFWNKRNRQADFHFGIGTDKLFKKNGCPVRNCETTNDRRRLNESDLILFSLWDNINEMPKWRRPEQRWIFVLTESQIRSLPHGNNDLSRFNGVFNLSDTHRRNSNFTSLYIKNLVWRENKTFNGSRMFMENKTKMAFTVISNCYPPGMRHVYSAELSKHIKVDVYGKCGKKCPNKKDEWGKLSCKLALIPQYKFYLSFENAICEDYITEKFFGLLKYDIIPVVYGAGPYDLHVPKSGFINAFDFESPRHLAEYMIKVASNETLYNSYFQWKRFISFIQYPMLHPICEMCIMLNLEKHFGIKQSVIQDMNAFWDKSSECKKLNTDTFSLVPL